MRRVLGGLAASVLLAACGPLATSCPFVLFGAASPTVGGQVRVPISASDPREVPAANGDVALADAQGLPLPGVHAQSAKDGSYAIPNTEPGYAYVVLARVKAPDGSPVKLKGLAQPGPNGDTADVNEATTVLTTGLTDGLTGMLGAFDAAAYDRAVALVYNHVQADGLPPLMDKAAVLAKLDAWKGADPELKKLFDDLRAQLSRNQPPLADVLGKLATRDHQPTPGPVATGTPAPAPTPAPSAVATPEPVPSSGFHNGVLADAQFNGMGGMAFDNQHRLFVADSGNHRIRMVTFGPDGPPVVTSIAGTGTPGNDDDRPGDQAQFNDPRDVVFDGDHTLYVAEATPNRIRSIDLADGFHVRTLAGGQAGGGNGFGQNAQFDKPVGLAYDPSTHLLYVAEDDDLRAVDTRDGGVTNLAGAHGKPTMTNGAPAAARFNDPQGLVLVGRTLYVADAGNHLIRQVTLDAAGSATQVAIAAGKYEAVTGSSQNSGKDDGDALDAARFNGPVGLAADPDGNLYVADRDNRLVRKLTVATRQVSTVAGPRLTSLVGKSLGLVAPSRLAFDGPTGYLSDRNLGQLFQLP